MGQDAQAPPDAQLPILVPSNQLIIYGRTMFVSFWISNNKVNLYKSQSSCHPPKRRTCLINCLLYIGPKINFGNCLMLESISFEVQGSTQASVDIRVVETHQPIQPLSAPP